MASVRIINNNVIVTANEMNLKGSPIRDVGQPTLPNDVATKSFVDAALLAGSGSGAAFTTVLERSANFTILSNQGSTIFNILTSGVQLAVALPLNPLDGFTVRLFNKAGSWSVAGIAVSAPVGNTINGAPDSEIGGDVGFVDFVFDAQISAYSEFRSYLPVNGNSFSQIQLTGGGIEVTNLAVNQRLQNSVLNLTSAASAVADAIATSAVLITSGNKTAGTAGSGSVTISTGNSAGGSAGSIILNAGAAAGGAGARADVIIASQLDMSAQKIKNVATPTLATDVATKGYVDTAPSTGANRNLSNLLAPTSLNADLLPAADGVRELGSPALQMASVYCYNIYGGFGAQRSWLGASTDIRNLLGSSALPLTTAAPYLSTETKDLVLTSGINSLATATSPRVFVVTKNRVDAGVSTGKISLGTGSSTSATSGDIELITGAGTTRGKIKLDAVMNLAVQTAPATPVDGDMWFDGTALRLRVGGITRTVTVV